MIPVDQFLNVAIAFDHNYLAPFYALVESLLRNNRQSRIHLHVIATGIAEIEKNAIVDHMAQNQSIISFYSIDQQSVNTFVLVSEWTAAVYYRLYFPLLIDKKISRLLYLDADTLVIGDLRPLFREDLEGKPVGAVYDNYVKTQELIGIAGEGEYFNSGVLLIDVALWNEQAVSQRSFDYLIHYPERIRFVDQCALNAVLKDNWKHLGNRYNLLYSYLPQEISITELKHFVSDKVIIHFTLQRPWNFLCKNRLRYLYHFYLSCSESGRSLDRYTDFSICKIGMWFKLRLIELYTDSPLLRRYRKILKTRIW